MSNKVTKLVLGLISTLLLLGAGITVLVLSIAHNFQFTGLILGIILLVISIIRMIDWAVSEKHKNRHNVAIIFAIATIVLGILFITEVREISLLCFAWGIIDIVCSLIEIQFAIPEIRHNKLCILKIAVSMGELVFGILLCIELERGLTAHLIYLSISFFLLAILSILETFLHHKSE